MKPILILLVITNCVVSAAFSEASSILSFKENGRKSIKTRPALHQSQTLNAIQSQQAEQLQYRGFLIVINRLNGGKHELQVTKTVQYGDKKVSSLYASQYETSVEYEYEVDSATGGIRQDHYLYPANSLTGWANPGDYVTMREFAWKGKFPSPNCKIPIHTSEEFGREYLEASCFASRDAALQFAKRFVNYVLGPRGL